VRLRKVIKNVPKPMVEIAGRPFLEYLILQLSKHKIKEIILSIGHKGYVIKDYFQDGSQLNVKINYAEESEPLGTGGGIREAVEMLDDNKILVMNGDSFFNVNIKELIAFHNHNKANATIALATVPDMSRYGEVIIDGNNQIVSFSEKGAKGAGLINGGMYVLNREVFAGFPRGKVSLEHDIFPKLINKGLLGMRTKGFFIDIGMPEDYLFLCRDSSKILNVLGVKEKWS